MAVGIEDLVQGVRWGREYFLGHLKGVRDDQWDWKPYPECKSIRETLAHLVSDDRAFIQAFRAEGMPDFAAIQEHETDVPKLLELMKQTREELCRVLEEKFASAPLDTPVAFFGRTVPLLQATAYVGTEDAYHAGQVAFIRMASDPGWDYYAEVYG